MVGDGTCLTPGPSPPCGEGRNDRAKICFQRVGLGGAREGWLSRKPSAAVEHDRGRGGTWMAGCAWWVGCGVDLTPGPFPAREGESTRRSETGRGLDWIWPPCGPPVATGGRGFPSRIGVRDMLSRERRLKSLRSVVRVWVVSWGMCEWVWVRGLAGVWGKFSWRSRWWPAGRGTVAMGAALRRS